MSSARQPDPLRLWGVDMVIEGNESRIALVRPIVLHKGELGVARSGDWSVVPQRHFEWPVPAEALQDYPITQIDSRSAIDILPGQAVVLLGPSYAQAWESIAAQDPRRGGWHPIQSNFRVLCTDVAAAMQLMRELCELGTQSFDTEFKRPQALTRLEPALTLVNGNSTSKLDQRFVRRIVFARATQRTDLLRREIELASVRLHRDTDAIRKMADEYEETLQRDPLRGLPSATFQHFADAPERLGELLRSQLQELSPKSGTELKRFVKSFAFGVSMNLDHEGWTDAHVAKMWHSFSEPLPRLGRELREVYPDCVKQFAVQRERAWRWTSHQWQSWAERNPIRRKIRDLLSRSRHQQRTGQWKALLLGVDQFPESRLIALALEHLCAGGAAEFFEAVPLWYGTERSYRNRAEDTDLYIRNEVNVEKRRREKGQPIFRHRGYYAFATHRHLTQIAQSERWGGRVPIPTAARQLAKELLEAPDEDPWSLRPEPVLDPRTRAARCWIALCGSKRPETDEFIQIREGITRIAATLGETVSDPEVAHQFDGAFRNFVREDDRVFLGGSIHSRFILRWLKRPLRCATLLAPDDFPAILGSEFFGTNVLVRGDRIVRGALWPGLVEIFQLIWKDLTSNAQSWQEGHSKSAAAFLHALMAELIASDAAELDRTWSVAAHTEDMARLLIVDNTVAPPAPPSGAKERRRQSKPPDLRVIPGSKKTGENGDS